MSDQEVVIEKGIELPPVERAARESKYPFDKMEVSDSFFRPNVKASAMHACVTRYVKNKGTGKKFTVRTVTENGQEGVRVWRIE